MIESEEEEQTRNELSFVGYKTHTNDQKQWNLITGLKNQTYHDREMENGSIGE